MNKNTPLAIRVQSDLIPVTLDSEHEFTLPTALVAKGYGVTPETLRSHKLSHADELIEGKHFSSVENINAGNLQRVTTLWTKRGIIRLGFFIKSERAKLFRDAAEDLITRHDAAAGPHEALELWKRLALANERIIQMLESGAAMPITEKKPRGSQQGKSNNPKGRPGCNGQRDPRVIRAVLDHGGDFTQRGNICVALATEMQRSPRTIARYAAIIRGHCEILATASADDEYGFTMADDAVAAAMGVSIEAVRGYDGLAATCVDVHMDDNSIERHWTRDGIVELAHAIGESRALDFAAVCEAFEPARHRFNY